MPNATSSLTSDFRLREPVAVEVIRAFQCDMPSTSNQISMTYYFTLYTSVGRGRTSFAIFRQGLSLAVNFTMGKKAGFVLFF